MSNQEYEYIISMDQKSLSLHNYIFFRGRDINDVVRKYLILTNLKFSPEDFVFT